MSQVIYSEGAQDFGAQLFNCFVSDEELAAATGALSGAMLFVRIWKQAELRVEMQHEYIEEYSLMFRRDLRGALYIWNDRIEKKRDAPKGVLLECHLLQVENAPQLGVERLELYAAGDRKDTRYNGYYVWPLYGYDAPLTNADRVLLTPDLAETRTIQDIFALGGNDWWSHHGDARRMVFDLAPNSPSMKRFQTYLRLKRKGKTL